MRRSIVGIVFLSLIILLLIQFPFAKAYANVDEQAANEAFSAAQEIIAELEEGIEKAGELLEGIKERGIESDYEVAEQVITNAKVILDEAKQYENDSSFVIDSLGIAKDLGASGTGTVSTAVALASRVTAETAQLYAKMGLLFLRAPQFATVDELTCPEYPDIALWDKDATWNHIEMIVALADRAFKYANAALTPEAAGEDDEEEEEDAAISIEAAKKGVTLVRELKLHLETFEDLCRESGEEKIKDYKNIIKDLDDDKNPSPV